MLLAPNVNQRSVEFVSGGPGRGVYKRHVLFIPVMLTLRSRQPLWWIIRSWDGVCRQDGTFFPASQLGLDQTAPGKV